MTDQNTETLPETIRWLATPSPEPAPVEVSLVRRRTGVPYRANVTVDGRSLYAYGATPEEAMEAVDQQWEKAALRQCPWLPGGGTSRTASMESATPAVSAELEELRFYTTDDGDEHISNTDAGEAIYEYLKSYDPEDWPAEIEVFAYRRVPVSEAFKRAQALAVFSDLVDALEEHYGDEDFYFDMEALHAAERPAPRGRAQATGYSDPVPSKPAPPPPPHRAVRADQARDAAFAAARAFVEAVVAQYKVGRLEEVKDERATVNTAQWVRENCPEWETEEDVVAALAKFDAEAKAAAAVAEERYCGCGDQLAAEEVGRCGRCDIEKCRSEQIVGGATRSRLYDALARAFNEVDGLSAGVDIIEQSFMAVVVAGDTGKGLWDEVVEMVQRLLPGRMECISRASYGFKVRLLPGDDLAPILEALGRIARR